MFGLWLFVFTSLLGEEGSGITEYSKEQDGKNK
jgi:hypothetical protein